ncbi:MAG: hypothetical protein PHW04_16955 [Candidatus Wallbacteria bacterium]|nr:hypothetical protein [Candidatus Wallbacteria bacterium]
MTAWKFYFLLFLCCAGFMFAGFNSRDSSEPDATSQATILHPLPGEREMIAGEKNENLPVSPIPLVWTSENLLMQTYEVYPRPENEFGYFVELIDLVKDRQSEDVLEKLSGKLVGKTAKLTQDEGFQLTEDESRNNAYPYLHIFYQINEAGKAHYGDTMIRLEYNVLPPFGKINVSLKFYRKRYRFGWTTGTLPVYRIFPDENVRSDFVTDISTDSYASKIYDSIMDIVYLRMIEK